MKLKSPRSPRSSLYPLAAALAASLVLSARANGQEPQSVAEGEEQAEEIIVTAQFRAQRLQDTPIAITAVASDVLQSRSQTSIADIGNFAPSVNLSEAASIQGNAVSAFIRGIGQEQANFALEPGVGIYIDDIYYGTTFGAVLDLTDLDRVEVLRGPQGTLSGKNSLGGAVKLFSKKPDDSGGGFIEGTYGSYDRIDIRASGNFTVTNGLYARVSGVSTRRRGFMKELDYGCVNPAGGLPASRASDDCVVGRAGGKDLFALRGALRFAPDGSPLELNIVADVSHDNSEPSPMKLLAAANPGVRSYDAGNAAGGVPFDTRFLTPDGSYTNYSNYAEAGNFTTVFGTPYSVAPGTFTDGPRNNVDSWGIAGTIDYRLSEAISLKSITGYRQASGTTLPDADGSPLNIIKSRLTNSHKQFTQELRVSGKIGDLADVTIGGFYYEARDRMQFRIQLPIFLYDFITDDPVSNRSVAAFAHGELHLTPELNVIGALRYTDDKKTYQFRRTNPDGSPVGTILTGGSPLPLNFLVVGLDGLSSTFKGNRLDYRIGANYRFSNELMAYAQVATGYKGGGINPQPFVPDQVQTFDPETLTTYELGFKADLFDRRLRLNGAAFLSDYDNIQRTVYLCPTSASTACGQTKNIADARYKGVELEAQIKGPWRLKIDGSLAYIDPEYRRIIDPNSLVTAGMRPPFASEWQLSAGAEYPIVIEGAGRLTPRVDWSYLSSYYYQAVNTALALIPPRSLVNARLSYESQNGDWTVSASVTNLTKKYYLVGVAENMSSLGNAAGFVGRPREWALTVGRKF